MWVFSDMQEGKGHKTENLTGTQSFILSFSLVGVKTLENRGWLV